MVRSPDHWAPHGVTCQSIGSARVIDEAWASCVPGNDIRGAGAHDDAGLPG